MNNFKKLISEHNPKIGRYTVIDNEILFLENPISPKAGFFYLKLLSLPPDWDLTVEKLAKNCGVGKTVVQSAFNELKERGYLEWEDKYINGKNKRFYTIREKLKGECIEQKSKAEKQVQNCSSSISAAEKKESYINTKHTNTNDISTKDKSNKYKRKQKSKGNIFIYPKAIEEKLDASYYEDALDENGHPLEY